MEVVSPKRTTHLSITSEKPLRLVSLSLLVSSSAVGVSCMLSSLGVEPVPDGGTSVAVPSYRKYLSHCQLKYSVLYNAVTYITLEFPGSPSCYSIHNHIMTLDLELQGYKGIVWPQEPGDKARTLGGWCVQCIHG